MILYFRRGHSRRHGRISTRMEEILGLAAQGLSDTAIAERLGIKPNTVAEYWKRHRKETGLRTRVQMVLDFEVERRLAEHSMDRVGLLAEPDAEVGASEVLAACAAYLRTRHTQRTEDGLAVVQAVRCRLRTLIEGYAARPLPRRASTWKTPDLALATLLEDLSAALESNTGDPDRKREDEGLHD